ncbi:uncharacterized protein LOC142317828 [Lycorma delicatula]|uniref:uncharacterized protein LOC142317828 n=1 Tax=Lycorma delicatula TaxID=130591 RepID=UPI003F50D58B
MTIKSKPKNLMSGEITIGFSLRRTCGIKRSRRREKVTHFVSSEWLFGSSGRSGCVSSDNCPIHHCRFDSAVIHGFCCGCARITDHVPVHCPSYLRCPSTSQPLCSDYDFMMDCCC